jgi:hypothetical protein
MPVTISPDKLSIEDWAPCRPNLYALEIRVFPCGHKKTDTVPRTTAAGRDLGVAGADRGVRE